jgi:hypothetical protein
MDPLINGLDCLLPFLRSETELNWTYDVNGKEFKQTYLYQRKLENATSVQDYLTERVNEWSIQFKQMSNQLKDNKELVEY